MGRPSVTTPTKRIRDLRILSPNDPPVKYPLLEDWASSDEHMLNQMMNKGYSQTISNKVLFELDARAAEISGRLPAQQPMSSQSQLRRKRYNSAHKPMFLRMESISNHYAASRLKEQNGQHQHDVGLSATKKRRTLNGPEEMFGKENESPLKHKMEGPVETPKLDAPTLAPPRLPPLGPPSPTLAPPPSAFAPNSPTLGPPSPTLGPPSPTLIPRSPVLTKSPSVSPTRSKISPSKGHMNLHQLLSDDTHEFAKPAPPHKVRQSSLQEAGVQPLLNKKPLAQLLHKKTLIPSLQKKLSIPSLNKKPSALNLLRPPSSHLHLRPPSSYLRERPSATSLLRPPSSHLQKKPSIPSLQNKSSIPCLQKPQGQLQPSLPRSPSSRNFTVPKPFSLYDKPTILSSQKSLNSQPSMSRSPSVANSLLSNQSHLLLHLLNTTTSLRSISKFQRFKS